MQMISTRSTIRPFLIISLFLPRVDCFTSTPSAIRSSGDPWPNLANKLTNVPPLYFSPSSSLSYAKHTYKYRRRHGICSQSGADRTSYWKSASLTSILSAFSISAKPRDSEQSIGEQICDPLHRIKLRKDKSSESSLFQDTIPSFKTMLLFISTTILIWLSEPLLSLVDTTVVGQYSNVLQLAALGPATMLMDSAIYLTYFLAIATTNIVANGIAKQDYRQLQTSTSQVLGLATILGTLLTATIFSVGQPLVNWAAGGSSSPELIHLALQYCQIRSLVAPLAILGMVAQSVCLACLDTNTPVKAVVVASMVNVVGDIALVPYFGMAGAAAATAAASSSAALLLLRQTRRTMMHWHRMGEAQGGSTRTENHSLSEQLSTERSVLEFDNNRGAESLSTDPIPLWSLPNIGELLTLLWKTGPIFFCIVGKIICYSALSLRATDFGVPALAAHNVMIRIFFLYATFGDSLSQASQTFVPRALTMSNPVKNGGRNACVVKLLARLATVAAGIGVATKFLAEHVLTKFGSSFTQDASILAILMNAQTASWAGWALLLHPFIMLLEGCILASQDLVFLLGSYVVTMACHFSSLRLSATSFSGVWRALFFFQTFRLLQFTSRVWNTLLRETARASDGGALAASNASILPILDS